MKNISEVSNKELLDELTAYVGDEISEFLFTFEDIRNELEKRLNQQSEP